jgi:7,8-dihydro-6-hydroxymethylpterin-pyrophosphokinase
MKPDQTVLIGVKSFSNDGLNLLKSIVHGLQKWMTITKVSSVYRVQGIRRKPRHIHDLHRFTSLEGLAVCIKGTSALPPDKILDALHEMEGQFRSEIMHRSASLNLLVVGSLTIATPVLTLPHPEFHEEPEQLVPAVEIWPDYEHPVLGVPLEQLVRNSQSLDTVEFFAQGKTLLDF